MEFPTSLTPLFHHPSLQPGRDYIDLTNGDTLAAWSWERLERLRDRVLQQDIFARLINEMGKLSAQAQSLGAVITTSSKFIQSKDRIYLHVTLPNQVNGILRVGEKKLFIRDEAASIKEITPSCVLDFYVHESKQRSGIGKVLFEFMLDQERLPPSKFGYDRPSPKLLAFLSKHYDLSNFVPQNNNFVVFRKYFSKDQSSSQPQGGSSTWGRPQSRDQHHQQQHQHSQPSHQSQSHAAVRRAIPSSDSTAGRRTGGNVDSPRKHNVPMDQAYPSNNRPTAQRYDSRLVRELGSLDQPASSSGSYDSYDSGGFNPLASPPPGQASFRHFEGDSYEQVDDARRLEFEEEKGGRGGYGAAPMASPLRAERPTSGSSSSYAQAQASPSHHHHQGSYGEQQDRRGSPAEQSRLARAGSNMLSQSNLHSSPSAAPSSQSRPSAAGSSSSSYNPNDRSSSQYPQARPTQYHQHNIITGYQSAQGHSNFANQSKQPARFLPDGIPSGIPPPNEIPIERKTKRAGIQPRPLLDPAPNGLQKVDRSIGQLEQAIRDKEAQLAAAQRFAIPYRQPNERDAGWSKAASYQRVVEGGHGGAYDEQPPPSSLHTGTGTSEKAAQYSNPMFSTKVGGMRSDYANPYQPPAVAARSPFAYGNVRR